MRIVRPLVATVLLVCLPACSGGVATGEAGGARTATPTVGISSTRTAPPASAPVSPAPRPSTLSLAVLDVRDGVARPDKRFTPGASYADAPSREVVCAKTFVPSRRTLPSVRPGDVFSAYGIPPADRKGYRLDRLVPVALGGDGSVRNVWPQPASGPLGFAAKDELEVKLRRLVCAGTVPLADARAALATDWVAARQKYGNLPVKPSPKR